MQTSIRSTTDSTQHGDLPRRENDGGNSWKRLRSSLGLARDDESMTTKAFGQATNNKTVTSDCLLMLLPTLLTMYPFHIYLPRDSVKILHFYNSSNWQSTLS